MINIKLMEELTEALEKVIEVTIDEVVENKEQLDVEDCVDDYLLHNLEDEILNAIDNKSSIEDAIVGAVDNCLEYRLTDQIEEIAECYLDSRQARDLIEDKVEDYLYDLEDRVNDILEDSDIIEDKVNDILKDSDIIKTEICMPNYELRLAELEINNIYNELYKEVLWQRAR